MDHPVVVCCFGRTLCRRVFCTWHTHSSQKDAPGTEMLRSFVVGIQHDSPIR
jgi:hypothetical protein